MKWYQKWLTYICLTQNLSSGKACPGGFETDELLSTEAIFFPQATVRASMSTLGQYKCD